MSLVDEMIKGKTPEEAQPIIERMARLKARADASRPRRMLEDKLAPIVPASREQVARIRKFEQEQKKVVFDDIGDVPF